MDIKVHKIQKAILEGKSFDPFIVYPNTLDIFDGHHRFHAIIGLFGPSFVIPYIEDNRKETEATEEVTEMAENRTESNIDLLVKEYSRNLKEKISGDLMLKSKWRHPGESIDSCVARKIPKIKQEHPEKNQDQVVGAAYGMCKQDLMESNIENKTFCQFVESAYNLYKDKIINKEQAYGVAYQVFMAKVKVILDQNR